MYIHLLEATDDVDLAVPSADRLGSLVPGAGHLVHMPGHIYMRVGRYADAAAANVRAVTADENYITQCRAQGMYPAAYYPHNIHFLHAALAMEGRSREAVEAARKVARQHDHQMMHEPGFGFAHLLKSLPVLTLVRFSQWDEILREPEPPADQVFGRAMHHFARGYAQSSKGNARAADAELVALRRLAADPSLQELKIMDLNSLATLASIGVAMLEGQLAQAAGQHERAIASHRRAVGIEDALLYSEPPDWFLSPRQYLGDAYLAAGKPADAERTYREDLRRHRNNGWALYGLERSLRQQAKVAEADATHTTFLTSWSRADLSLP